jgi:predicted nucleotide-binding protein
MPTVPEVIQGLDALLAEISSLMEETSLGVPLLEEKVEQWARRVHVTLSNWGRGDDANRFTGASYTMDRHFPRATLEKKMEARKRVLQVLRDDVVEHQDFWETQLIPKRSGAAGTFLSLKPNKIFLGHGGNPLWSKVHFHLKDELRLNVQAWESESRASRYPLDVLKQLLDSCTFAVLVQTGEDRTSDGNVRARQNVIHEIGLFQGRLGFERVALVEQEGVESFSNIHGLQVVRFPGQTIEAAYYELDRMLVREKLVEQARAGA